MNPPPPLLIRADAGGELGTGHVMRMIALAQAWQDRGGSVTLAACQCPAALIERLKSENIDFILLGNHPLGGQNELAETIQLGKSLNSPWIVVDGYHFRENYHKTLRENGFKILAVDDYGHCDTWNVDLILNQNLNAKEHHQNKLINLDDSKFLLGTKYALLRREVRNSPQRVFQIEPNQHRILITFGGVDPIGASLTVLKCLNRIPLTQTHVKVLAGPANPGIDALLAESVNSPFSIEIIPSTSDMPSLYQWANRVISAGGSSCYEWMYFGIPGWVTSIAKNQDQIVALMLDKNIAAGLPSIIGSDLNQISASIEKWLNNDPLKTSYVVDGYGALRVAAAMNDPQCWVRPVSLDNDARFLIDLANHESVRSVGRHPQKIEWNEHIEWLHRNLISSHSRLMIIETLENGPVGQIRFNEIEPNTWEIGISIHPDYRKAHLASTSLSIAMQLHERERTVSRWLAEIKSDNLPSQRLFSRLGFFHDGRVSDMQTWHMKAFQS